MKILHSSDVNKSVKYYTSHFYSYFSPIARSSKFIFAFLFIIIFYPKNKANIHRLGGVTVKAAASRAEDRGSIPGRVIPKT